VNIFWGQFPKLSTWIWAAAALTSATPQPMQSTTGGLVTGHCYLFSISY